MIKLALTDLDDTLIPFSNDADRHASDRAVEAIRTAQAAGLEVGPVTGRPPQAMQWMFPGHPECYATGAFVNGQIVCVDGRVTCRKVLRHDALQATVEVLDQMDCDCWLAIYDVDGPERTRLVTRFPERVRANTPVPSRSGVEVLDRVPDEDIVKANLQCSCDRQTMARVRDAVSAKVDDFDLFFPSMTAPVIDISPAGWGKGEGARALAEVLGLSMDEVCAFGDSDNDLPMIEAVPNSVAVANASAAVSARARWHIGASRDEAVADALLELARAYRAGEMPSFMR